MQKDGEERYNHEELGNLIEFLSRRKDQIVDKRSEYGDIGPVREEITVFVVTAHATIEELSTQIITRHILDYKFSERAYDYVYSGMSQSHRERLLTECGILTNQFCGRLDEFKGFRNLISHEPYPRIDWNEDDVEEKLDLAIEQIERLYTILREDEIIEKVVR